MLPKIYYINGHICPNEEDRKAADRWVAELNRERENEYYGECAPSEWFD